MTWCNIPEDLDLFLLFTKHTMVVKVVGDHSHCLL